LSDELDIVGAGVAVLVGEVEADPRATSRRSTSSTGSGENRLAEAVWRNPAAAAPLVIGARVMWERVLDFSELSRIDPSAPLLPFNMRSATGATTKSWLAPPIRARDQAGLSGRWTPVGVNPT
jgi:hypothetical protein